MYILNNLSKFDVCGRPKADPHFWEVLAAGVTGLASLAGGLLGSSSASSNTRQTNAANLQATRETNEANMKIAQQSNEYNKLMFDQQLQHNWDMFNATNEYNSAANQRARLEEAGLNPYMMMNGGSAGSATSNSASTPPTAATPTMQTPHFENSAASIMAGALNASDAIGQITGNATNAMESMANARKTNAEADMVHSQAIANIVEKMANSRSANARAAFDDVLTSLKRSTFSDDVNKAHFEALGAGEQVNLMQAQQNFLKLQTSFGEKQLQYFDQDKLFNYSLMAAQKFQAYAAGKLSIQQARTEIKKRIMMDAQIKGQNLSNEQVEKLMPHLVDKAQWESEREQANAFRANEEAENVYLFGIPNPSYTVETDVKGSIGVASGHSHHKGYGNIRSAKKLARDSK